MALPQLRLVSDPPPAFHTTAAGPQDATRRIFEHWLFMLGRSPARCKLGPTRRQAINAALAMGYDVDMLLQACEGMAADPLERASADHIRAAMREIEWLFKTEARIEHWAALGAQLREQAEHDGAAPPAEQAQPAEQVDPAQALAARERLRALAQQGRGGRHG